MCINSRQARGPEAGGQLVSGERLVREPGQEAEVETADPTGEPTIGEFVRDIRGDRAGDI